MAFLWSLIFVDPLIVLSTVLCGSVSLVLSMFDHSGRKMIAVARVWARSLLRITRVDVTVEGLDRIDPDAAYVFVSNHLSYMDTPVVLSHIPAQFRFMAKEGLFKIPFLGTHLKQAGHISVPREDPRAAVRALTHAAETVRDRGVSVLVFPEGGRSEDGELHEFKEGGAYIAIKAGVPAVPVALIGTRQILAMHSSTFRSGAVTLRIGEPIPTAKLHLHARGELTKQLRSRIVEMIASEPLQREVPD